MNQSIPRNSNDENTKPILIRRESKSSRNPNQIRPGFQRTENHCDQSKTEEVSRLIARFQTAEGSNQRRIDRFRALCGLSILFSSFVLVAGFLVLFYGPSDKESSNSPANYQVDLNTANYQQLCAVPKIGPTTARRIIEKRQEIGRYRSLDELLKIKGIGPKSVDALKNYLVVKDLESERH